MRRPGRLAICLASIASFTLSVTSSAVAASATPAEDNLVRTYSPILMVRAQEDPVNDPCNTTEEQFSPPTWVEAVLGNPEVTLVHRVDGKNQPVKQAPTAAEIAGLNSDYYLNLPGSALSAGCTYAKDFSDLKSESRAPPITYA